MRRRFCLTALLLLALLLPLFAVGCGGGETDGAEIVCTVFPIYDWTREILGDRAEVYGLRLLSENGNDPHNYQPTVRDIVAATDATVLFAVGGISDVWVEEIAGREGKTLYLIDEVDLCEAEHDHEEGAAHDHEHGHSEIDEHFWLSLGNAKKAVAAIARALSEVYPADADTFARNAAAYSEKLDALDARYRSAVDSAARDTVIVADRYPFLYLFSDYGIHAHAAFPGCSAETEASFATVVSLAEAVRSGDVRVLLITETGTPDLARTVLAAAGRQDGEILTLHSCQSVTSAERAAGTDYLSVMEANLAVLTRALAGN